MITIDFLAALSREEREQRDIEQMNRRRSSLETIPKTPKKEEVKEGEKPLRPGDPGWVYRARVPQPSAKDYVNRPQSSVEGEVFDKKVRFCMFLRYLRSIYK